jgi:pilus assembly protein Flp/PilA
MRTFKGVMTEAATRGRRFLGDDKGATAIEYALIASGIAVAISATLFSLGTSIKEVLYDKISSALSDFSK